MSQLLLCPGSLTLTWPLGLWWFRVHLRVHNFVVFPGWIKPSMPFSSNQEISSDFTGDLSAGFVVDFGAFKICDAAVNLCPIRVLEVAVANVSRLHR